LPKIISERCDLVKLLIVAVRFFETHY